MIPSILSTCKWQCFETVNTPTRLKINLVFIYEPKIPKIYFVRKPTFGNKPSCICHQVNEYAHVDEEINNFLNKDNSLMTNAQKDSSIKAPVPNIFCSNSNPTSSINLVLVTILGFSHSKHTLKSEIIILASYLNVNLIAFLHPTKLCTMHKTLQCGSNMIAIML